MLSLQWLYTDNTNDNANDDDANDNNDTRQTNHDCIGSLACMPNKPKIQCQWAESCHGRVGFRFLNRGWEFGWINFFGLWSR